MLLLSYHLRGGRFECKDLDIKDDYWGWMVLGQDLGGEELYTVEQTGTITILRGNGNAYAFYAETFQGSGEPGVINDITVDPGATGDFSLLIEHPDGYAGALDWNEGKLTYGGGRSYVTGIKVADARRGL